MYDESSAVLRVVGSLLERANRGVASIDVQQCSVLSIEEQSAFLGRLLSRLNAGPIGAKDQGYVRSALQSGYMLKKYRFGGNPTEREAAAIRGFMLRNSSHTAPSPDPWLKARLQSQMRKMLERALPTVTNYAPRFGEGSVAEHIPWMARWERIAAYPELHQGFHLPVALGLSLHGGDSVRLCAVPKDYSKDRLITVEPWLGTFVQHATRRLCYESIHAGPLKGSAMDALYVAPEPLQREYAVEGSKNGSYATLDLSDASDYVSLDDVLAVFPPWLCAWLTSCRTPDFVVGKEAPRALYMYAGMGNATTFCVQTLYFWAAFASIAILSGNRDWFVSVHGDDVVSDNTTATLAVGSECLRALGIHLNYSKSYWGLSSFRESCGIWALRGQDVTPSRFDGFDLGTFRGQVGFADVIHRMQNSGCGMQLMLADRLVKGSSSTKVVPVDIPSSGQVFDKCKLWVNRYTKLETRLNRDLQVLEARVEILTPLTMRVPTDRVGYLYGALLGSVTTNASHTEVKPDTIGACFARLRVIVQEFWAITSFGSGLLSAYYDTLGFVLHLLNTGHIRAHAITIPSPDGELTAKRRWVPLAGFPMGVCSRLW